MPHTRGGAVPVKEFFLACILTLTWVLVGVPPRTAAQDAGNDPPSSVGGNTPPATATLAADSSSDAAGKPKDMLDEEAALSDRVDLRTFRTPDLFLPTDHLLGDWAGFRTRMEDSGVTSSVTWVSNMAGNPTGGLRQGFTECENLGFDFMSDLDKIYGIPDARFHVSASQRSGLSLSNDYIGNTFNVQQVYGGETFKLIDAEYIKRYNDGKLCLHAGRLATGDDFLSSPYYWFFMSNAIDGNPVGIFKNAPGMTAYPNATWGARLRWRPTDRTYIMGGVYNGDPDIHDNNDHGVNGTLNGPAFVIGEAAYQCNGLPNDKGELGTYKIGAYYDGNRFAEFNDQFLGDTTSMFSSAATTRRGNWGYYALADQMIFRLGNDKKRGVGVFASILVSPDEEISTMPFFCNGGLLWRGPIATRPDDCCGFAVIFGNFSDDLRDAEKAAKTTDSSVEVQDYELVYEWSYRIRMREGAVYVQPDLQYIVHPNGMSEIPNAFVVGCQMGVNF